MIRIGILSALLCMFALNGPAFGGSYPIVDSGQNGCFDNQSQTKCPKPGDLFNGQDSQYKGNVARYRDNGDGTVSDLVTGLMWVKARGYKLSWQSAINGAQVCRVGGYDDWRAPSIKELYSLMDFNGWVQGKAQDSVAFIDTRYFDFAWGNTRAGARIIDCQDWSSTLYKGTTMGGNRTAFGVNFADGRIKGYPTMDRGTRHDKYIRYVRGNPDYGRNDFVDNGNGTISDKGTGLVWQKSDDGKTRNWEQALSYCENLTAAGRDDWRLPSAKELQSIVDYSRSPSATNSAAIDPIFGIMEMESYFWSATTHLDGPKPSHAAYVAFGRAMGYFAPPRSNSKTFMDVHGAGAQRSDPKSGDPSRYSQGHGPQGDDIRINNYVRCVSGGGVEYYEPSNDRIPEWKGVAGGDPNQPMGRNSNTSKGQGRRGGAPQEAFDACNSKSSGDRCKVQTPRGTIAGICQDTPEGTVCVPKNGRGRRSRQ